MRFFKINLITFALLALVCAAIQAQSPSTTARPSQKPLAHPEFTAPIGCQAYCLWYAGDTDISNTDTWNALFNGYVPNGVGAYAQVWVPFPPKFLPNNGWDNAVKITSVTFNEVTSSANPPDVTSMTYAFKGDIYNGGAGPNLASGNCNYSQPVATGRSGSGYTEYAYTCKLSSPVTLLNGYVYWVNLYPTLSNNDTSIFLSNVADIPAPNHYGWGNEMDYSFFNSSWFGVTYGPATSQSTNLDEFSVAITGTYLHINPIQR
jgi:hypothetical protein